ncbi:hydantoinase/oxoprolinase N-terminal domain-containing protein [Heyndrickxia coagulans]|uniref:hydantoinase/oxoprolinase N-terminal domain-containing protein n=1 Tax=Heyndrickxia coagulans TaxID=1398 RepID=UPI000E51C643|nr:hydantoinase/oxoprolinase N-terminal domain-containing protein [Heyndrickxia coagulans]MED4968088.1 hydantoinase/oxoprolinase N-terminal domain-containing protein [Heyndrickxia coagulans]RGR82580.1 hydantoinase/oxoprolinase [Heyndrickxia coagulans]RGR94141.1 hydantoinase/oxoprolinase [Heyndrickxia coagulans]
MKIGIDIGGTNTHAVLVSGDGKLKMVSSSLTTPDVYTGVYRSMKALLQKSEIRAEEVKGIYIGTTELMNAVYDEKVLAKTALIRIARRPVNITPALKWPATLRRLITEPYFMESDHGYNKSGGRIADFKPLEPLYQSIADGKVEAVSIVGSYSPLYENEEVAVKNEIRKRFPEMPVTVSHSFGSLGFVERENAALLNSLLSKMLEKMLAHLADGFSSLLLECPFWLTQNNGSLMSVDQAMKFPVLTLASGAANSLKGAAKLSGLQDVIAVDIGGSKVYAARVAGGELPEVMGSSDFPGLEAGLEMPEIISLPFGTGNRPVIRKGEVELLPLLSNDIKQYGVAWGGDVLTVSDCFLKLFPDAFYDPELHTEKLKYVPANECAMVVQYVVRKIKEILDRLQNEERNLPIVLVGGGSPLFNPKLFGKYEKVLNPAGYPYSGAIGACDATISEVSDKVYWLNDRSKEEVVAGAASACKLEAIKKGADPDTVKLAYIEEYPFEYMKGEILRIKIKAVGEQIL